MKNRSVLDRNLPHDSALKAAGREMNVVGTAEEPKGKSRGRAAAAFWSRPSTEAAARILDVAMAFQWHSLTGCEGAPTLEWLHDRDERKIRLIEVIPTAADKKADKEAQVKRRGPQWQFFSGTDEEWDLARAKDAKAADELQRARGKGGEMETQAEKRRKETPRTMFDTSSNRSATNAVLAPARVCSLIVSQVIGSFGTGPTLLGLLMHRYPRPGRSPYARDDIERSYRRFRPAYGDPNILKANPHLVYAGSLHRLLGNMGGRYLQESVDRLLEEMERQTITAIAGCWADVRDMQELADLIELVVAGQRSAPEAVRSAADTRKDLPQKWDPGLRAEHLVGSVVRVEPVVDGMAPILATVTTEIEGELLLEFGVKWGTVVGLGWITENCSPWHEPEAQKETA